MSVKLENGLIYINASDIGWHIAGIPDDAKINWPDYAPAIELLQAEQEIMTRAKAGFREALDALGGNDGD